MTAGALVKGFALLSLAIWGDDEAELIMPGTRTVAVERAEGVGAALPHYRDDVAACRRVDPTERQCLALIAGLGAAAFAAGELDAAEAAARRAIALGEAFLPAESADMAMFYSLLGQTLDALERYAESEPLHRRAIAIVEAGASQDELIAPLVLNAFALGLGRQGRLFEAEQIYRLVVDIHARVRPGGLELALGYNNLGQSLSAQRKTIEAGEAYQAALDIRERLLPPGHADLIVSYFNLGHNLAIEGQDEKAEAMLRKAMPATWSPTHPRRIHGFWALAAFLHSRGRSPAEARTLFGQAAAGARARIADYPAFTVSAQRELREFSPIFIGQVGIAWTLAEASR